MYSLYIVKVRQDMSYALISEIAIFSRSKILLSNLRPETKSQHFLLKLLMKKRYCMGLLEFNTVRVSSSLQYLIFVLPIYCSILSYSKTKNIIMHISFQYMLYLRIVKIFFIIYDADSPLIQSCILHSEPKTLTLIVVNLFL